MSPGVTSLSPMATRVKHLVETKTGGSQRAFAGLIGCSHASISKILTGKIEPGGKILHLISGLPNINVEWLRTGAGSPFMTEIEAGVITGLTAIAEAIKDLAAAVRERKDSGELDACPSRATTAS